MVLIVIGLFFALLGGGLFKLFPPKNINIIYGWRSRLAMRNKDTWAEAQRYGSNAFIIGGIVLTLIGVITQAAWPELNNSIMPLLLVLVTAAAIIFAGESHLRKIFNKDGSRKHMQ